MRLGKWRPENGWRGFSTDLIVVVLGVLIALGAEQSIGWLHRQGDVNSFRSALRDELSNNFASYQYRLVQPRCVASRLTELKTLRDRALAGEAAGVDGEIGRPSTASLRTGVWTARSSEVMDAMPLEQRLAYSSLYDELAFNFGLIDEEREAWRSLARFNGSRRLSKDDAQTLSELVWRAVKLDEALRYNRADLEERFTQLGIGPSARMKRFLGDDDGGLCAPLSH